MTVKIEERANNRMQPTRTSRAGDAERYTARTCGLRCEYGVKSVVADFCFTLFHLLLELFASGLLLQPAHETLNNRFDPCFPCLTMETRSPRPGERRR